MQDTTSNPLSRRDFLYQAACAGIGIATGGCALSKRGRHRSSLRPNILFAIADDASYPHMAAYGCSWVTSPGFDRVARNGVLFTNAYTPNAKCAPSRACILTGRNSWQLEEAANHWCYFPAKFKTYAEVLEESGYAIGYTGKGWAPGNPGVRDGRPRELCGRAYNSKRATPPTKRISKIDYAGNFADFLDQQEPDRPFCFWYGGREPHRRYEHRSGIEKGGKKLSDLPDIPDFLPDNEMVRADLLDYAYELEHFDDHLQRMLDLLEARGQLDNTIVVVTTDNGMPFPRVKGQSYEYSNHLPLAIMGPVEVVTQGRVVDDYVSFIDLAPTFLQLAQVGEAESGMAPITGRSLLPLLRSSKSGRIEKDRDHVLLGKERHDLGRPGDVGYPIRAIIRDGYLYVHNFEPDRWPAGNPETGYLNCDGSPSKTECLDARGQTGRDQYWHWSFDKRPREELYCIENDADCLSNLVDHPEHAQHKERLRDELFTRLRRQGDPRCFGRGEVFDRYEHANEKVRNYYERYQRGEDLSASWVNKSDFKPSRP